MNRFGGEMAEHRAELVALDTAIGDGDHGTNMNRGMTKALEKIEASEQADAGAVLKTAAMALISSVGGAAGPLYGTLFLQMGNAMAGQSEVDLPAYAAAWRKGLEGVQARGKATCRYGGAGTRGHCTIDSAPGPSKFPDPDSHPWPIADAG